MSAHACRRDRLNHSARTVASPRLRTARVAARPPSKGNRAAAARARRAPLGLAVLVDPGLDGGAQVRLLLAEPFHEIAGAVLGIFVGRDAVLVDEVHAPGLLLGILALGLLRLHAHEDDARSAGCPKTTAKVFTVADVEELE